MWYSFTAVDSNGKWAVTNPIWVKSEGGFSDVLPESWYFSSVMDVNEKGLMNGTGDGTTFSPNGTTTRAMVATVLYRMVR